MIKIFLQNEWNFQFSYAIISLPISKEISKIINDDILIDKAINVRKEKNVNY